jgi:hypothetical protein
MIGPQGHWLGRVASDRRNWFQGVKGLLEILMPFPCHRDHMPPAASFRPSAGLGSAFISTMLILVPAHAGDGPAFDTENLFGFVVGTDIGNVGEMELETQTAGAFGKRSGSFAALSSAFSAEYTPARNLRMEIGALVDRHDISGVLDLDDVHRTRFQGVSFEIRYRLLERQQSGIGLALLAEPHWLRVDDTTGERVAQYGSEFAVLVDKELVADRIVAAFNLLYEPDAVQSRLSGMWSHEAVVGAGSGLMVQLQPGFSVGAEARYLMAFDSLGFNRFAGQALFIGPNVFYRASERLRITAAWNVQAAGKAVADPGTLDLTNFSRHQIRIRIGFQF